MIPFSQAISRSRPPRRRGRTGFWRDEASSDGEYLAADRRTATKTGPSVATGGADASSRQKECAWMPGKKARSRDQTVVRDRWNAGSTAQPAYGFPGTPPSAIVHAVPEFIWGMSDRMFTNAIRVTAKRAGRA